jgi:PPP family 3-phenylpropionic acid transporter
MSRSATGNPLQASILAASYLLLFAYIGIYLPWFPPLLGERGFDARMIGFALALVSVSRIVLPPAWGLLADRLSARKPILIACSLLAGLAMLVQAVPQGPGSRMAWLFVHGFFLVPLFPLMDAVTLGVLGSRADQYGRVRLWGSIGFIAASLGFGALARRSGTSLVPWAAGLPLIATALLVPLLRAPPGPATAPGTAGPARGSAPMPWRLLVPLILAAACGQASHGPYYAFFTLQMEARGLAPLWIGSLWAWGVL